MKATRKDLALLPYLRPYTAPKDIPVVYTVGDTTYRGFPAELSPKTTRRRIDSCIYETNPISNVYSAAAQLSAKKEDSK